MPLPVLADSASLLSGGASGSCSGFESSFSPPRRPAAPLPSIGPGSRSSGGGLLRPTIRRHGSRFRRPGSLWFFLFRREQNSGRIRGRPQGLQFGSDRLATSDSAAAAAALADGGSRAAATAAVAADDIDDDDNDDAISSTRVRGSLHQPVSSPLARNKRATQPYAQQRSVNEK